MLQSLTPETTPTCEQPHGTSPEQVTQVSSGIDSSISPPLHPQAKSASHMPARATFPNNGKQVDGKAGSVGAVAMCQHRARHGPEAASCRASVGGCSAAGGVEVGAKGSRESSVAAFLF